MTTTQKVANFAKQVLAQLKGDENTEIALRNARKADSAYSSQLAALKAKLVDDEVNVEEAQEAYHKAKYPKTVINDNKAFVQNVKTYYERLERAQETLSETKESIKFFESLLKEASTEVDA